MPNIARQAQLAEDIKEFQELEAALDKAALEGDVRGFFETQEKIRKFNARQEDPRRKERCPDCGGNGWYPTGPTDNPVQVECERCGGYGFIEVVI